MKLRYLFWSLCVVFAFSCPAFAQRATLSGTVTDQNGAAISKAAITAIKTDQGLKREVETNDEGYFTITQLQPGRYTVRAQHDGFTPSEIKDVVLHVEDRVTVTIQMTVSGISETVKIVNNDAALDETPSVSTVVDRQFVENLPLNGRSFQSLIALTPGVVLTRANGLESGQFSVNGQRANANYFMVDGVSANIGVSANAFPGQSTGGSLPGLTAFGGTNNLVSVDALQEFKIQTSTYAPEFGRTPGGQVSIITRSGTNEFHGTLFEYFRNDVLDANDWFANARNQSKPALRQNQFGGVLGGRLIKNRTFFFFSYEGLRLRLPQTATTAVPSMNARRIAPSRLQPFLNAFPLPNGRDLGNERAEFSAGYSDPSTLNATSMRIDHTLSEKLTVFGRYNDAPSNTVQRGAFSSLNTVSVTRLNTQTFTAGAIWAINSKTSSDLRFNYSRAKGENTFSLDNFGGAVPPPDSLLFPSFTSSKDAQFGFSIFSGIAGLNVGKNVSNLQRQINLVDTLSVVTGAHQLKFGIDYRRLFPIFGPRTYLQQAVFSGVAGPGGTAPVGTVLSGSALRVDIVSTAEPRFPVFTNFSLFAQDTWRTTQRMTLTYGLRWEVNPPPTEQKGNDPLVVTGLDNPVELDMASPGTQLYKTTYNNFAPRVGLAYKLYQAARWETVLRGGFGIFYDLGTGPVSNVFGGNVFPYAGLKRVFRVPFPLPPAEIEPPPLNDTLPTASDIIVFNPELKLPRTYQWNFTVEQSLGANQTLSASYVAAVGRQLLRQDVLLGPNANFPVAVFVISNGATSDYHALQLQFNRRLSRGLQTLASYNWSHSIDDFSTEQLDIDRARGASDFDVRHSFTAAITYNIPTPGLDKIGSAVLGGWSIDTIFRARSAAPVSLIATQNFIGTEIFNVRPDLVSGVPVWISDPAVGGGRRINIEAFTQPPTDAVGNLLRQGTLGRNALRGFPFNQLDLALRRQLKLKEQVNLQFKIEFFNLFNHPNFGDPGADINAFSNDLSSPFFGQSTQMLGRSLGSGGFNGGFSPLYQIGGPRSIQLSLKVLF